MTLPSLRLKANADRRLRAGHLWVYSNEVDTAATPWPASPLATRPFSRPPEASRWASSGCRRTT